MKIFTQDIRSQGFTLIEMTVVLFIISLLMLIILPNISGQRDKAKGIHNNAMKSVIQNQVDTYLNDHPDDNEVTYEKLENSYLTSDQINKAKEEHIEIKDNKIAQ